MALSLTDMLKLPYLDADGHVQYGAITQHPYETNNHANNPPLLAPDGKYYNTVELEFWESLLAALNWGAALEVVSGAENIPETPISGEGTISWGVA